MKPTTSSLHIENDEENDCEEETISLFRPDINNFINNTNSNLPPIIMSNILNYLERFLATVEKGNELIINIFFSGI